MRMSLTTGVAGVIEAIARRDAEAASKDHLFDSTRCRAEKSQENRKQQANAEVITAFRRLVGLLQILSLRPTEVSLRKSAGFCTP